MLHMAIYLSGLAFYSAVLIISAYRAGPGRVDRHLWRDQQGADLFGEQIRCSHEPLYDNVHAVWAINYLLGQEKNTYGPADGKLQNETNTRKLTLAT
jgi:hypothetical protein